ncbi:sulfurtransferase [Halorientalis marina]|jgi:thiosulfate/3-mercaptopyruvate sulfurtransferase|uniref:sulfurtransferase n=1 Tax=Halorientalis marina TaxID=2931976 RepID=UPI001FF2CA79|nr:sulfurtransferase [Halorientalis marina]
MTREDYPDDVLVSADWVTERLDAFRADDPAYRLVEVDVNPAFYETAHVPGAVGFDWQTQLRADDRCDLVGSAAFGDLLGAHGVTEDTTLVLYGDNANWFATYCYWLCRYYGHEDVRILDGGRRYWLEEGFPTTDAVPDYPAVAYDPSGPFQHLRAYREDVLRALDTGTTLLDVRTEEEYRGEVIAPPGMTETARRAGHIPGATHVLWAENVRADGTFRPPEKLRDRYAAAGVTDDRETIVYCRIGERSSITWFALTELLGYDHVRNYDGSWTEWGNLVGAPIEVETDDPKRPSV